MFNKSLVLASLIGASFAAQAVTVDLRHEYIDNGANADRVAVSHRFANGFGFSVEAKWKSGGDKADQPFADVVGNGHEDQISWRWKATDNIALTPAFTIESNDSRTIINRTCTCNTASIMVFTWRHVTATNIPVIRPAQIKTMTKLTVAMPGWVGSWGTGVPS